MFDSQKGHWHVEATMPLKSEIMGDKNCSVLGHIYRVVPTTLLLNLSCTQTHYFTNFPWRNAHHPAPFLPEFKQSFIQIPLVVHKVFCWS